MRPYLARILLIPSLFTVFWLTFSDSQSQEMPQGSGPPGQMPQGVEVQARGPVHEAFATPTGEPKPTAAVNKKPPAPLDEMPPEEKPEGDMSWIAGYWAWDDDRSDYLWVSGCWRAKPQGKDWVPGYWREQGVQWQWVPGFWANGATKEAPAQQVTYYAEPPVPPQIAPPPQPAPDMMYVPGNWYWYGDRYQWRAGYWIAGRPGYIYVAAHYRWTPSGYVFVPGYWDLVPARRGVLYAPVVVDPVFVVRGRFVYTPVYAVPETVVLDAMFVRPAMCHYYFGDYYGPRYVALGFETNIVYSRRHYDPIVVYQRWDHRSDPHWFEVRVNLVAARDAGRAPLPPRTIVHNTTIVNNVTNVTNVTNVNKTTVNNTTIAPAKSVMASQGMKSTPVDPNTRAQIKSSSQAVQQTAMQQRQKSEVGGATTGAPRSTSYNVPASSIQSSAKSAGTTTTPGAGSNTTANKTAGTPSTNQSAGTNSSATANKTAGTNPTANSTTNPTTNPQTKAPPPKTVPARPTSQKKDEGKK